MKAFTPHERDWAISQLEKDIARIRANMDATTSQKAFIRYQGIIKQRQAMIAKLRAAQVSPVTGLVAI